MKAFINDLLNDISLKQSLKNYVSRNYKSKKRKLANFSSSDFHKLYKKIGSFVFLISKFIVTTWLFSSRIYPKIGFEKTVIILLSLLFVTTLFKKP